MVRRRIVSFVKQLFLPAFLGLVLAVPLNTLSDCETLAMLFFVYFGAFLVMFMCRLAGGFAETVSVGIGALLGVVISCLFCNPSSLVDALGCALYLAMIFSSAVSFTAYAIAFEALRVVQRKCEEVREEVV